MDEQQKAALRSLRDKYIADRDKNHMLASLISAELGEPTPGGPSGMDFASLGSGSSAGSGGSAGADPVAGTAEGEFFNYNSTDAAYDVLKKYGSRTHPLKTKQIFDAIKKGGVQISVEQAMYRSLARSHRFRKVGPGSWGLAEWYPKGTKTTAPRTVQNADGSVTELPPDDLPDGAEATPGEASGDNGTEVA